LICEPEMSPVAYAAAPPPRETNSATAAMIVAGCLRRLATYPSEPMGPDDYAATLDSCAAGGDDEAKGIRQEPEGDMAIVCDCKRSPFCGAVFYA
jgi:hypothetical protein